MKFARRTELTERLSDYAFVIMVYVRLQSVNVLAV